MKEEIYDDLFEEKEEKTNWQAILFKYVIRWPWFIASVILCLVCAWFYLKTTTPVYNINASIIIKDDKKGGNASDLSAFEDIGIISSSKNIDNEIEILRSKSLIKDVVSELGLYINYSGESGFNKTDLYGSSPVLVHFLPEDAERLTEPILLSISYNSDRQIDVTATVKGNTVNKHFTELPAVLSGEAGTLTFMSNPSVALTGSGNIEVSIVNPLSVAKGYRTALSIEPTSKTTSVVTVSVKNTSKKRGEDFINKLIEIYNKNANNDKNEVAQNTARFIDERISVINQELGTTEQELESFKREAGLTDLSSDAQLAISEQSVYEKLCVENGTQLNLIQYLSEYIRKPENVTATLPANVGLNDETLSGLIAQYNALILERNRLLRTSSETNPVVRRLDSNIEDMRAGIITTIASVRKGLLITKADLDRQAGKYAGRISNAPAQERRFVSIQRQQEIKAGLYLMLLQKREENNIALAATANNAKIIDDAIADDFPISPQSKKIYMIALVVGLGNRAMTPDVIGPRAADHVPATRHLKGCAAFGALADVSVLTPGVLGTTGLEAAELVRGAVETVRPDLVVAVDALASQSLGRVCTTVQLTDAGIVPGSGVGNHRRALTRETLGVPVFAVGVPTVVDAATLALDLLDEAGADLPDPAALRGQGSVMVTPRDIDARAGQLARVVGFGVGLALQPSLSLDELRALID